MKKKYLKKKWKIENQVKCFDERESFIKLKFLGMWRDINDLRVYSKQVAHQLPYIIIPFSLFLFSKKTFDDDDKKIKFLNDKKNNSISIR